MPKGVEHTTATGKPIEADDMPTSVMPKGVEHGVGSGITTLPGDAHLCDAERR